ncbi:hypothetical protein ACWGE0_11895 [Lentzea sp. NPDC054927]
MEVARPQRGLGHAPQRRPHYRAVTTSPAQAMPVREVHGPTRPARMVADLDPYRRFQADHLTRINGVQTEIPMPKVKLASEFSL